MSRLNKKPILLGTGVAAAIADGRIVIRGPKGEKAVPILSSISVAEHDGALTVSSEGEDKQTRMNEGTTYSLLVNAIRGVTVGFSKTLELVGTGYRAELEGKTLVLSLGFSHPIRFVIPDGIETSVKKNTIAISGVDKELVGRVAAKIRSFREPEPYKGKGIKYEGEVIIRKVGKKAATAGAAG